MSNTKRFLCKTQKKIGSLLPSTYRSLTNIKDNQAPPIINAQIICSLRTKNSNAVSLTPELIRSQLLDLLSGCAQRTCSVLQDLLKGWLEDRWKDLRLQIISRINKLKYLEPSLINQSYSSIEKEMLIEWKKNPLLHGFQLLANHVLITERFSSIEQIKKFYNQLRTIIAQMTYLIFEPSLAHFNKQQFSLEDKLYNYTAVTILTSSKAWPEIAQKIIKPQFFRDSPSFSENFNLLELNARPQLIDFSGPQTLYKKTAEAIRNLETCYSSSSLINGIKQYRKNLLEEIQTNISSYNKKNENSKQIVIEKEDILSCIIYTLVVHKLDNIGVTLKYINFLYGQAMENVLGSFQVDCYRVDLEVSYEYLTQTVVILSIEDFDMAPKSAKILKATSAELVLT